MRRSALLLPLAAAAVAAGAAAAPAAKTPPRALPAPSFTVTGPAVGSFDLAAAGSRVAVAAGCEVWVAALSRAAKARPVRMRGGGDSFCSYEVWLGRRSVVAESLRSEARDDAYYSLWKGRLPSGPLRQVGEEWGSPSSSAPLQGCEAVVAAGGGVIATMRLPKALDDAREPGCPASGTTVIALDGASRARTIVQGSWELLATDGKRLVLAGVDGEGRSTGELSFVGLDGKPRATPRIAPAIVKGALAGEGWLVPEGLVLDTTEGIAGPGWTIRGDIYLATVGYGRVLYFRGNTLRVRRIRDGVDRKVLTVPRSYEKDLAAGSFGVAVAIQTESGSDEYRTSVYRLGWRVIDAVLPQRP